MKRLKLFEGWVSHSRSKPVEHTFRYRMFQVWVDVKQISTLDQVSRWWSSTGFNLVQFKRQNYLPSEQGLYQEICATIKQHTGNEFDGDAYLLANLSYWGICFNPVVFIACYEGDELRYLVSEVHNTPWDERFVYVHDTNSDDGEPDARGFHVANFDKAFLVSPFRPRDLQYRWKYKLDDTRFFINMVLLQDNESIFNVTMQLDGEPLSRQRANLLPFRFPIICIKVVAAIYWQALCLWFKRVPLFSHPK
jgi:DUF1365 family protein